MYDVRMLSIGWASEFLLLTSDTHFLNIVRFQV